MGTKNLCENEVNFGFAELRNRFPSRNHLSWSSLFYDGQKEQRIFPQLWLSTLPDYLTWLSYETLWFDLVVTDYISLVSFWNLVGLSLFIVFFHQFDTFFCVNIYTCIELSDNDPFEPCMSVNSFDYFTFIYIYLFIYWSFEGTKEQMVHFQQFIIFTNYMC